jgi:hypothetical protein
VFTERFGMNAAAPSANASPAGPIRIWRLAIARVREREQVRRGHDVLRHDLAHRVAQVRREVVAAAHRREQHGDHRREDPDRHRVAARDRAQSRRREGPTDQHRERRQQRGGRGVQTRRDTGRQRHRQESPAPAQERQRGGDVVRHRQRHERVVLDVAEEQLHVALRQQDRAHERRERRVAHAVTRDGPAARSIRDRDQLAREPPAREHEQHAGDRAAERRGQVRDVGRLQAGTLEPAMREPVDVALERHRDRLERMNLGGARQRLHHHQRIAEKAVADAERPEQRERGRGEPCDADGPEPRRRGDRERDARDHGARSPRRRQRRGQSAQRQGEHDAWEERVVVRPPQEPGRPPHRGEVERHDTDRESGDEPRVRAVRVGIGDPMRSRIRSRRDGAARGHGCRGGVVPASDPHAPKDGSWSRNG